MVIFYTIQVEPMSDKLRSENERARAGFDLATLAGILSPFTK